MNNQAVLNRTEKVLVKFGTNRTTYPVHPKVEDPKSEAVVTMSLSSFVKLKDKDEWVAFSENGALQGNVGKLWKFISDYPDKCRQGSNGQYVNGKYEPCTSISILVPIDEAVKAGALKEISLTEEQKRSISLASTESEKGRVAEKQVMPQLFLNERDATISEQLSGADSFIGTIIRQCKYDKKAYRHQYGGTGNICLEVYERNPGKKY